MKADYVLSKDAWLNFMDHVEVFGLDIQQIGSDPYNGERIIIILSDGLFTFKRSEWEIILELWDYYAIDAIHAESVTTP